MLRKIVFWFTKNKPILLFSTYKNILYCIQTMKEVDKGNI